MGYLKDRQKEEAIISLLSFMNHHQQDDSRVIFGDISKAFDSINHKKLIKLLQKTFQLSDDCCFINYVRDMYEGLYHTTQVNNSYSDVEKQEVGIKQGCCLSPLLFIIFFNHVVEKFDNFNFKGKVVVFAYADDIAVGIQKKKM